MSKIEAKLAEIRTWEDYRLAVASERGFLNATMETIMTASIQQRAQMLGRYRAFTRSNPTQDWIFTLLPRFVIRENQLRANHYFDEISARIAAGGGSLNLDLPTPSSADHLSTELEKSFYFLFSISSPVYQTVEQRYIRLQTLLDEARLACALERFRLSHGGYPATLLEMTPELIDAIPTDIYARVPYRYQRLDNGSFRLYSVGQNRRDDGGSFVPNVPEQNQLDAVWPYAPAPVAP